MAKIIVNGKEYSNIVEAALDNGMSSCTLGYRLSRGYTGKALTRKTQHREGAIVEVEGVQYPSLVAAGLAYGVSGRVMKSRILQGRIDGHIVRRAGGAPEHCPGAQPVIVNGVHYPSISNAAQTLQVGYLAIAKRVEKARKETGEQLVSICFDAEKDYREKPVVIDGKHYPTVKAAAAELGVNYQTMASRIKNGYYERQRHKEGRV